MHKRFVFSSIILSGFVAISVVGAHVDSLKRVRVESGWPSTAKYHRGPSINARAYRSPGDRRKVVIQADNVEALAAARKNGAVELADYRSFKLMMIESPALEAAMTPRIDLKPGDAPGSSQLTVRDDFNVLFLRSGAIDTTADDLPGTLFNRGGQIAPSGAAASLKEVSPGGVLRLVQFIGPVKSTWLDQLHNIGVELIAYVPSDGYLIRVDPVAYGRLGALAQATADSGGGFVQWEGPFDDAYKIHPALADTANSQQPAEVTVAVQFALGNSNAGPSNDDVKAAKRMAGSVIGDAYDVLNLTNLRLKIAPSRVADLARLASVINIEPWDPPQLLDEESAQIVAGQLTTDGTQAKGPGYIAWLAAHGFASAFNFAIDVTDSGIDRGSTDPANLHPDFLDSSKQSRVLYARDYTSDLDPSDVPGHGTLNLSVAGGANSIAHDSSGYSFGIGVAPFVKLGSSKIFLASGAFDLAEPYTKLISEAYRGGARISSNSWGASSNQYTIDSQEYDTRVRDADPGQPGNQETVICFAAGNGSLPNTINSPGSGKNVISVGASESSRTGAVDGCGVTDAESITPRLWLSSPRAGPSWMDE
jgi:hypothetical protein